MRIPVEQRRAALAEAALRIIAREGVHAATTRAIAAEAGMPLASVHYAYASRDELLREVVRTVVAGEREASAGFVGGDGGADDGDAGVVAVVRGALAAYVDLVRSDPGREQGMLELTHYALRTPELAGVAQEQYAQYRALVTELLESAAARLRIRWTAPLDVLARTVIAFTDGITQQWAVDPDQAVVDAQLDLVAAAIAAQSRSVADAAAQPRPAAAAATESEHA